jgi:adenylate kinase family enzyme
MMQSRLDEYYLKTHPLAEAFKEHHKLVVVDATASIEAIHAEVVKMTQ